MPDAPAHLVEWFQACGVCGFGAAGIIPISACEIMAWAQGMRREIEPWEFDALLSASRGYCAEHNLNNFTAPDGQELPRQDVGGKLQSIARMVNKT